MKKILLLILIGISTINLTHAQDSPGLPLTADSLATGNYKDLLTSFFQLAFDKFTSQDKEVKFSSNPFAVMSKLDTSLLRSSEYYKYRHLRDLNFSFSARLDSSYKFNGFTSGLRYAIINRRDETVSKVFLQDLLADATVKELFTINLDLEQAISSLSTDSVKQNAMRASKDNFFKGITNFDELEPELQEKIKTLAKEKNLTHLAGIIEADPQFNWKKTSNQLFDDIKEKINNKLLWTASLTDTTYNDQFLFSNVVLSTEIIKGIDEMKTKDFELNIKSAMQFVDDENRPGRDLKRSVFSFEPGFNLVFKTKTLKSYFEFKLSGSYYRTFGNLYQDEKRDNLTMNSTIRVRILNDIWVPLEIKYDPRNGNVLGFLNLRANFSGLNKLLSGGANKNAARAAVTN